jgi:hypothetical protein
MDELSPRARALLAEVRDGHDPPADVSARVWHAVSADIAGAASIEGARVLAQKGALAGKSSLFASKMFWVAAVVVGAGAGGIALRAPRSHDGARPTIPAPIKSAAPQNVADAPNVEAPAREQEAVDDAPAPQHEALDQAHAPEARPSAKRQLPREDTLLAEVNALRQASDMLAGDRPGEALALLRAQDKQFAKGTLHAEREALILVARCSLDPAAAARSARAFIAHAPNAVLRARVENVCKLNGEAP